ncbi:uncharacterized protein lrriq1 [Stigmatopora nigra]
MLEVLLSSSDSEDEDDNEEEAYNEIPASMLSYFEASRRRAAACEELFLEDLEDLTALQTNEQTTQVNVTLIDKNTKTPNEPAGNFDEQSEDDSSSTGRDVEVQVCPSGVLHDCQQSQDPPLEAGGKGFHDDLLRHKQQEHDFDMELKRMLEMAKLRLKEADMMEVRAQELLEQEFRFQQELLDGLKRQLQEEVKKGNEEQKKMVLQQNEKEELEKCSITSPEEDVKKTARGKVNKEERNEELEDKKQKEAEGKQIGEEHKKSKKLEEGRKKIAQSNAKEEVDMTRKEKEKKRKQVEEEEPQRHKQIQGVLEEEDKWRKEKDGKLKENEQMRRKEEETRKWEEWECREKWCEEDVCRGEVEEEEEEQVITEQDEKQKGRNAEVSQLEAEEMKKEKNVNGRSKKEASMLIEEEKTRRMSEVEEEKDTHGKEIDHDDKGKRSKKVEEKRQKDESRSKMEDEESKCRPQMKEEATIMDEHHEEMTRKFVGVDHGMKEDVEKQLEKQPKKGEGQKKQREEDWENALVGEQKRKETAEDEEKRKMSEKQDVRMKMDEPQEGESEPLRKKEERNKVQGANVKSEEEKRSMGEGEKGVSKEGHIRREKREKNRIEEELKWNLHVEQREACSPRKLMAEKKIRKSDDKDIMILKELQKREERMGEEVKVLEREKREAEKMKQGEQAIARVIEGEERRNMQVKKERGEGDKEAKKVVRESQDEGDGRRLTRTNVNLNMHKNDYENLDVSNQIKSHYGTDNRKHEQINQIIQQHIDESVHREIHGGIRRNIHENIPNNNHHLKINEKIHETIHENIENIHENTQQNILRDVQTIDKKTHPNSDDKNIYKNIHENIHQKFSSQSGSSYLPQVIDQKRLSWLKGHIAWTELRNKSRDSGSVGSRRESKRSTQDNDLPPLCPSTLLRAAGRTSLHEVTILVLEDLPGCSLSTLAQCVRLQSLTFRRCGLKFLEGISQLAELAYVDVQENKITKVDCENMSCLRVLKLNCNKLTSIHGLSGAENLQLLELSHNSITRIAGLGSLRRLQRLCLDHNQLVTTKGLRDVCSLLHLDCSHNHLASAEGLESNVLLRTLDLTSNSLTEPPALHDHVLLGELRLDDNSLSSLGHLLATSWLPHLHTLTLAHNRLTHLPNMAVLITLANLDLRSNCLSDVKNICQSLEGCCSLEEVHLTGNPLQQESNWRCFLREAVSSLRIIDGTDADTLQTNPAVSRHTGSASYDFFSLIRGQRQKIDELQLQHCEQLSKASHVLDSVQLSSQHSVEALYLAEEQRRAIECFHVEQTTLEEKHVEVSLIASSRDGARPFCDTQTSTVKATDGIKMMPHQLDNNLKSTSFTPDIEGEKTADGEKCESTVRRSNFAQHHAATVIQAQWRGFCLRRKLTAALAAVTNLQTDDDALELVDVDDFVLDEEMLEDGWTLCEEAPADRPLVSKQALFRQLPGFYLEHPQWVLPPLPTRRPVEAWEPEEREDHRDSPPRDKSASSPVESDTSDKSDRFLEEWGFTSKQTAELMLRRALKMKSKRKDLSGHLESWRNHPLTIHHLAAPNRLARRHLSATRVNRAKVGPGRVRWERTRDWLRNQNALRLSESKHFLPDIATESVNSGQRQSAGEAGGTEHPSCGVWNFSTLLAQADKKYKKAQGNGTENKQDVTNPGKKERMSYQDEPTRRSGGWGGGKKRDKVKHQNISCPKK